MKKAVLLAGLILSILIGAVCGILTANPAFSGLIWVLFTTFALAFSLGAEWKKSGYYLIALVLGWAYAYGYFYAGVLLMQTFNLALPIALGLGVAIVTLIIILIHGILLQKTPIGFGMIALVYAPVISYFGVARDANMVFVAVAGVIGLVLAIAGALIFGVFSKQGAETLGHSTANSSHS